MLNKKIVLNGREVEFTLTRNPRSKHLRVRILSDRTVKVTSPPQYSMEYIEKFLLSKATPILNAIDRYSEEYEEPEPFGSGCVLWSLGQPYTIEIISAEKGFGVSAEGISSEGTSPRRMILTVRARDTEHARRLTEKWLNERLDTYIASALDRFYPSVEKYGVEKPRYSLKKMTSRWGSCSHRTHRLSFSTMLAEYPADAVDYVVMHELAHFIHPNHSKDFYAFVAETMPDWKRRRDILKAPRKNSAYFT